MITTIIDEHMSEVFSRAMYDDDTRTMTLRFRRDGSEYVFYDVPLVIFQGLVTAPSMGQYYHTHIKGRFPAPGGGHVESANNRSA